MKYGRIESFQSALFFLISILFTKPSFLVIVKNMRYTYKTQKTCSTEISLDIDGDVVTGVSFVGGCHGNLQAIPRLVEGLTVSQITERLKGINCKGRGTSCADQLVCAVNAAYAEEKKSLEKVEEV